MKRFITLVIILVLAGVAIYNNLQTKSGSPDQLPKVGFTAPYFSLKGMDQSTYKVEGKREKPLLINFWASWCAPCRQEAPDLRKLYGKYKDRVDFYAVNLSVNDQPAQAAAFVKEFNLSFPILMDDTGEVAQKYEIVSIPTTYLIDKEGIVRQKVIGMINPAALEQWLDELSK